MDYYLRLLEQRYKRLVFLTITFIFILAAGLVNVSFTSELRAYFSKDNPQLEQFHKLEANFNKQDTIMFIVLPNDKNVFTNNTLGAVELITDKAWSIPYSRRVISLTNTPITKSVQDQIISDPVFETYKDLTPSQLSYLEQNTINDPLFEGIVGAGGEATLVIVPLSIPDGEMRATQHVMAAANKIRDEIEFSHSHLDIHLIGTVTTNHAIEQAIFKDITTLIPISGVLIFCFLMALLRVLSGTLLTLCLITLTSWGTFGLFSWFGVPFTPVAGAIPTMLTVIAVADSIHLLITYYHEITAGKSKIDAINSSLKINFMPMLITSVTTAIGLLCLNFSDSPPYRVLGNTVAFGAILAFALTVLLLPALLHWLPIPKRLTRDTKNTTASQFVFMEKLGGWLIKHNKSVLVFTSIVVVIVSANIMQNKIDDQWDKYFDESFALSKSFKHIEEHLGGGHFLDFSIDSGESQGIYDPRYMDELERFTSWLEKQPEVGRVDSFSHKIKMLNQVLHGDNKNYYSVPNSRALISQSIMLYEMSLPFGMSIDDQVDLDRRYTRVTAYLYSLSSEQLIGLEQRAQSWASLNTTTLKLSEGTGIDIIFAHMAQRNSYKLLSGTLVALVLISLILIFVFKSIKLGLLSLIPNVIPVLVAYGTWGIADGKIDLALSIVGAMSLGIVVDDTVHFLAKYRYAKVELGLSTEESILYSFKTVGLAMLITSVILSLGFLTLALSHFVPTWNMGVLLSITISFALVFDFLLLPGVLILSSRNSTCNTRTEFNPLTS